MRTWAPPYSNSPSLREAISLQAVRPWEPGQLLSQENTSCFGLAHVPFPLHAPFSPFSVLYETWSWESLGGGERINASRPPGAGRPAFSGGSWCGSKLHQSATPASTSVLITPRLSQPVLRVTSLGIQEQNAEVFWDFSTLHNMF